LSTERAPSGTSPRAAHFTTSFFWRVNHRGPGRYTSTFEYWTVCVLFFEGDARHTFKRNRSAPRTRLHASAGCAWPGPCRAGPHAPCPCGPPLPLTVATPLPPDHRAPACGQGMLGFAAPPKGIEISTSANMAFRPPGTPQDFKPSMDGTDEADDEFDEHLVSMSEGESRGASASLNSVRDASRVMQTHTQSSRRVAPRQKFTSTTASCVPGERGARSKSAVELTLRMALCIVSRHLLHGHLGARVRKRQPACHLDLVPGPPVRVDPGFRSRAALILAEWLESSLLLLTTSLLLCRPFLSSSPYSSWRGRDQARFAAAESSTTQSMSTCTSAWASGSPSFSR